MTLVIRVDHTLPAGEIVIYLTKTFMNFNHSDLSLCELLCFVQCVVKSTCESEFYLTQGLRLCIDDSLRQWYERKVVVGGGGLRKLWVLRQWQWPEAVVAVVWT